MATDLHTNITKRLVQQKNREGKILSYDRYMLHYRDPSSGKRVMRRFETRKAAEAARNELITAAGQGMLKYARIDITVKDAVDHWLASCEHRVGATTYRFYQQMADWICGPVLIGTRRERDVYKRTGKAPKGTKLEHMIGHVMIKDLSTAQIRQWNQKVTSLSTDYMGLTAKKAIKSALDLTAEDYNIHVPKMPRRIGVGRRKIPRKLLTQEEVNRVIQHGRQDDQWGLYYVFPLLTGTRPSEQLGLLWEDVDLQNRLIYIRRSQNIDGSLKDCPKTEAGNRVIPMTDLLHEMLTSWKERCPRFEGRLERVFPGQGFGKKNQQVKGGRPMLLCNFRYRIWYGILDKLGIDRVAPYAARHLTISNLQAQGIDVATVAKIAGHANPNITMQYYTHSVRKLDGVMDKLNEAYQL